MKAKLPEETLAVIFEYLERFYNRCCRHSTLGYLNPVEFKKLTKADSLECLQTRGKINPVH